MKNKKKNVLVVAAHPDDETLGCAGTLCLHKLNKDNIDVIFMTDGVSSRNSKNNKEIAEERKINAFKALKILNINRKNINFFNYPDNQMDSVPLINIIKEIEKMIKKIKPNIIYTHFSNDLNVDHKITHHAVLTACRPLPNSKIEQILLFEVPSSTEWSLYGSKTFQPNLFIDIEKTYIKKIKAIKSYKTEIKKYPHARSLENIKNLIKLRGASVGMKYAEAFVIERFINKI